MIRPSSFVGTAILTLLLTTSGALAQRGQSKVEKVTERAISGAWWNDSASAERLGLDVELRAALDAKVGEALGSMRELRKQREGELARFHQSLKEGDLHTARKLQSILESVGGKLASAESQLKIDILSLLTAEQISKLDEEQLVGSWLRRSRDGRQKGMTERSSQGRN